MTQKNHKIDIFQVLNHISKKDKNFFKQLTDEEKKAFQPLIVMRWLTGTNDARQVYFINELVNPFVFSMYNHKELIYYLMTTCTRGKTQRYNWTKSSSKKSSATPSSVGVIKEYFNYSTLHAIEALPMLSNDDIMEYAEHLGRQKEDITKIKKELKTR
jgi:hypothetical protein